MKTTMLEVEAVNDYQRQRFVLLSKENGQLIGEYRPPDVAVAPGDTLYWEGDLITIPE